VNNKGALRKFFKKLDRKIRQIDRAGDYLVRMVDSKKKPNLIERAGGRYVMLVEKLKQIYWREVQR